MYTLMNKILLSYYSVILPTDKGRLGSNHVLQFSCRSCHSFAYSKQQVFVVCWWFYVPQHVSISRGRIYLDRCTCCHTEIEVADLTFYLTRSQYTDTGQTCPSADPITPGAWRVSHRSAKFYVTGMTRSGKMPTETAGIEPRVCRSRGGRLNHWANEAVTTSRSVKYSPRLSFCLGRYLC